MYDVMWVVMATTKNTVTGRLWVDAVFYGSSLDSAIAQAAVYQEAEEKIPYGFVYTIVELQEDEMP